MKKGGLQRSPLDLIEHDHARVAQICDHLEQIADSLPDDIDKKRCQEAVTALRFDLPLHHQDEEKGLFLLLLAHSGESPGLDSILERLSHEHAADEGFAEELSEELDKIARTGTCSNPEVVGYMLRGFFENYRRHMHWEQTILMPLARQILTADDLTTLTELLATHRQSHMKKAPRVMA